MHVADYFIKTVLLECINEGIKIYHYALSYGDCTIRVYRLFTTIFHKCLILLLIFILHFPIMLLLCLMLSMTNYAQNYAGIIGGSLAVILFKIKKLSNSMITILYNQLTMGHVIWPSFLKFIYGNKM